MASTARDASFRGDPPAAARETALPDRRELALVAVERTRMPMIVTDPRQPDNPIVLANEAFLKLTGYGSDEVIGRNCRFLQGPGTDSATVDRMRKCLASGERHIEVELLNYRKDGSEFWNQLWISPVHAADGELIYYFASQKDVSARRRAEALEATERLLLKEVDHRAMNALALVQSIIRMTRSDTVLGYVTSVLSRVDALARAHRLLSESGWSGARLTELIALETPRTVAKRVRVSGEAPMLDAIAVQPVVLVLHELMANAMVHGSLAQDGSLLIEISEDADGVQLAWGEILGSATLRPAEQGFGLNHVHGIIERQLGGRFTLDWHPDGLRGHLSLPGRTFTCYGDRREQETSVPSN